MRILEFMSFDPSWFLTVPGLLISGGVLLLLIALIVFISTSKKDKGIKVDPTVDGSIPIVGGPEDINNGMVSGVNNTVPTNINNTMGMIDNNALNQAGEMNFNQPMVNNVNPIPVPTMPEMNVQPQIIPSYDTPEVPTPVARTEEVVPTSTNISFDNLPQATINDTVNPEMQPVLDLENVAPAPVVDFTEPVQPFLEPTPSVEPQANTFINNNNNFRPIYGGANPMENTASIPTVMNHSAYNGAPIIPNSLMNEVKVVDNNQTTPISASDIFAGVNTTSEPTPAPATETIVAPTPIVNTPTQSADSQIETLSF